MKNEIILYQPDGLSEHIEVRIDENIDTVWLNRHQLSTLYSRDIKTIGKHIANALQEELKGHSVVAKFATTASDGKTYQTEFYNLEMIISVGYRVKSKQGVQFRIWANRVLKDYLLKGFALNNRMNRVEDQVQTIADQVNQIELFISTTSSPPMACSSTAKYLMLTNSLHASSDPLKKPLSSSTTTSTKPPSFTSPKKIPE